MIVFEKVQAVTHDRSEFWKDSVGEDILLWKQKGYFVPELMMLRKRE